MVARSLSRLSALVAAAFLWAALAASSGLAAEIFPLASLEPGLKGHGLTAGPGNVIERFEVEVLALKHDLGLGFPVVLVRASGDFIEASGGVAAGMSGSPVYLPDGNEDALLGAVGFSFPHSDHDLALVTPAEIMLDGPGHVSGFSESSFAGLGAPAPVATPLVISGLTDRAAAELDELFASGNVRPLPVQVSGARGVDDAYELAPGSAVGVKLVRGDINISAIGTLTLLDEDRFYAFGHPLLGHGSVSFALAPAYVSHIVHSQITPFKLADTGTSVIGTVLEDRPYVVSGTTNSQADFIPVNLTLNLPRGSVRKQFEVAPGDRYYPPLLAGATLQAFDQAYEEISGGTAELAWEIGMAGGDTLRLIEQTVHPADIGLSAARLAAEPLAILADNVFADPQVTDITLTIQAQHTRKVAELVEVVPDREAARPGERMVAHVRLQPYRNEPIVETVEVRLPADATGPFEVTFRGGMERGEPEDESELKVLSFAELLVALRDHVQSSELIVEAKIDGETVRLARLPQEFLIEGKKTLTIDEGMVKPAPPPDDEADDKKDPEADPPFDEPRWDRGPR